MRAVAFNSFFTECFSHSRRTRKRSYLDLLRIDIYFGAKSFFVLHLLKFYFNRSNELKMEKVYQIFETNFKLDVYIKETGSKIKFLKVVELKKTTKN